MVSHSTLARTCPLESAHPFRVLSQRGYTIGKFWKLELALFALRNWEQAASIVRNQCVIARRMKRQGGEPRIVLCQARPAETTHLPDWKRAS